MVRRGVKDAENTAIGKRLGATKKRTLRGFLEDWLNNVIKGNIKANTYTAYSGYIYNHIDKCGIAQMRLRDITPGDVQLFVRELSDLRNAKGKKLSGKTVHLVYDMLKTALNCAVDHEIIEKTPCQKIRLPKHTPKETHILTVREQAVLEQEISKSKDAKSFGVLICLYTGIRLGELCALKWSDIDLYNREMRVRRSISRITLHSEKSEGKSKTAIIEDTPKTGKSNRVIPLPAFLAKELRERKIKSNSEHIVSMKDGRCVQPRTMQDVFKNLIKKCGIGHTNFHALRHTYATRAIELNVNVCAVSEILGHSSISITVSRYIHALKEQKLDAARLFDKYFEGKTLKK